jgi:hypothetical protein
MNGLANDFETIWKKIKENIKTAILWNGVFLCAIVARKNRKYDFDIFFCDRPSQNRLSYIIIHDFKPDGYVGGYIHDNGASWHHKK